VPLTLDALLSDESLRRQEFPVIQDSLFLAHAGVCIFPRRVAAAMQDHAEQSCLRMQEYPEAWRAVNETRIAAARLIGAQSHEIALIGPTSIGLSLVAAGLDWQPGDEVVCYLDDYPANVYPWTDLARSKGVTVRLLKPDAPGAITPELVAAALTRPRDAGARAARGARAPPRVRICGAGARRGRARRGRPPRGPVVQRAGGAATARGVRQQRGGRR
jgi:selenocysteine lyase/cysteine desulfurase